MVVDDSAIVRGLIVQMLERCADIRVVARAANGEAAVAAIDRTEAKTLEGVAACLNPDASLVLGSAETVVGLAGAFEPTPGLRGVFRVRTSQRSAA